MTPAARIAAAALVLDDILEGQRAEACLSAWARGNRYAGSKDRAAVRDLVFDALRCRRSYAAIGGAQTGRGLMIGALVSAGENPAQMLTGDGYALTAMEPGEGEGDLSAESLAVQLDMPDWLADRLVQDQGQAAAGVMAALRVRAPVFVRANLARCDVEAAIEALGAEGVLAEPVEGVRTALRITQNERRVKMSEAFSGGLVEMQDASSQAAVLELPLHDGTHVLDFCAGGGGKSLAMACVADIVVVAHDALRKRMVDLPVRAARAGAVIEVADIAGLTGRRFDLVLVDAPCSGSGTWRRDPDAKWRFAPQDLADRVQLQGEILSQAQEFVAQSGVLAYATCSVLTQENAGQIESFLTENTEWELLSQRAWMPGPEGDGFYLAQLQRRKTGAIVVKNNP